MKMEQLEPVLTRRSYFSQSSGRNWLSTDHVDHWVVEKLLEKGPLIPCGRTLLTSIAWWALAQGMKHWFCGRLG